MVKNNYICITLLTIVLLLSSCEKTILGPKMLIEFEIEETAMTAEQKEALIAKMKRRLKSSGAVNIQVEAQKQKKLALSFQGTIKPDKIQRNFSIVGDLEFYEVCKNKSVVIEYLQKINNIYLRDTLSINIDEVDNFKISETVGLWSMIKHTKTSAIDENVFGSVQVRDKEKVENLLINRKPIYVSELKRRIKFLLGKSEEKKELLLYAVYVTSTNEAPLNGDCIISTSVEESYFEGNYAINMQMDEKGAVIWERLTDRAYLERGNIAIVIDDIVYVAPAVTSGKITGGKTQISANFTKEEAERLANAISSGAIPNVKISKIEIMKK